MTPHKMTQSIAVSKVEPLPPRINSTNEPWKPDILKRTLAAAANIAEQQEAELERLRADNERLRDALKLILPMAHSYARNNIGNNMQFIEQAKEALKTP